MGKTIHTAELAFLKYFPGTVAASVLKARENFNPTR